jgi:microsomal epoxide hydrolase
MDPRSQGDSSQESEGLYPAARSRDIKAVIDELKLAPVVLVGWSMGVTEVAAYVDQFGTADLAGIVLVDGIAGADWDPNMTPRLFQFAAGFQKDRAKMTAGFIRSMYRKPQSEDYYRRLTEAALKTPTNSAVALFLGTFTSDYRPALAKIDKPTLILAAGDEKTNPWMKLYADMQQRIPGSRLEVFADCGHALFVDDPARFNSLLDDFMKNLR